VVLKCPGDTRKPIRPQLYRELRQLSSAFMVKILPPEILKSEAWEAISSLALLRLIK
jgi:hypothetical protein